MGPALKGVGLFLLAPLLYTCRVHSVHHKSGGAMINTFRKIKKNVHKTLSPASVDKSVHKIPLPATYRAFLHIDEVIA